METHGRSFRRVLLTMRSSRSIKRTVRSERDGYPVADDAIASASLLLLAFGAIALARFVQFLGEFIATDGGREGSQVGTRRGEHQYDWLVQIRIDLHATKEFGLSSLGCVSLDFVKFALERRVL